jgi:LppX_LprAFG lipoprotein
LIRFAGAVLLAATLAGCGSVSSADLERSADATAAETSRFELSFRAPGLEPAKERNFTFVASGLFDYPNERGLMRMDGAGSSGDEFPTEFRLIGKTGYERWVFKGKTYWAKDDASEMSDDPTELLVPYPGGPTKPTDVLTRVLLASDETEKLGNEDVRGVETTRYRAKVDGRKLLQQMPTSNKRYEPEEVWGDRFVPVELWIDEESRVRRIRLTEDGEGSSVMTIEFFDYGVDVDVQPPPADQVISQDELEKLQAEAWEEESPSAESGKGELVNPEQVCEWAREELPEKDAEEFCREAKENQ